MKISINGQLINNNTYDSIGDAVLSKFSGAIHQSQWYGHTPQNFDFVENFNQVQAICGDPLKGTNLFCYQDSLNWSLMNKTELTADIYKFITHRVSIIRHGFTDNFLPKDFSAVLDLIDWNFVLDCVSWFI